MKNKITIKYVKRAKHWCKTTKLESKGKQMFKQEWSKDKPTINEEDEN